MKRLLLIIVFAVVLGGCGMKNVITGTEMFTEEIFLSTERIEYHDFDETIVNITDSDAIDKILYMLKSLDYEELDTSKYIEGFYSFVFFSEKDRESVGISENYIAIHGKQYTTEENIMTKIKAVIDI